MVFLYSRDNILCWLYDLQIFFTSVHVSFEFIFGRLCHSDFLCSQIYKFLFKGFFGIMGHDYKGTFWIGTSQCSLAIQFEVDFEYVQLYCSQALHKGWKILVILVRLKINKTKGTQSQDPSQAYTRLGLLHPVPSLPLSTAPTSLSFVSHVSVASNSKFQAQAFHWPGSHAKYRQMKLEILITNILWGNRHMELLYLEFLLYFPFL